MAREKGRLILLEKPDGSGDWLPNCGILTRRFAISNNMIESLKINCSSPGDKPATSRAYGSQDINFSGDGKFENETNGKYLADAARAQEVLAGWRITVPGYGTFVGDWLAQSFEWSGEAEGDMDFSVSIVTADASTVTYTAA